jgi:hypothetical protein
MDCTHFVTFLLCSKPFEPTANHPSVSRLRLSSDRQQTKSGWRTDRQTAMQPRKSCRLAPAAPALQGHPQCMQRAVQFMLDDLAVGPQFCGDLRRRPPEVMGAVDHGTLWIGQSGHRLRNNRGFPLRAPRQVGPWTSHRGLAPCRPQAGSSTVHSRAQRIDDSMTEPSGFTLAPAPGYN